jgi:hypothetical protein
VSRDFLELSKLTKTVFLKQQKLSSHNWEVISLKSRYHHGYAFWENWVEEGDLPLFLIASGVLQQLAFFALYPSVT